MTPTEAEVRNAVRILREAADEAAAKQRGDGQEFHAARDGPFDRAAAGWFVRRLGIGSIRLEHRSAGLNDQGETTTSIIDAHTFDADTWASIVCHTSKGGERDRRFFAAKDFLDSEGSVEVVREAEARALAKAIGLVSWSNDYYWGNPSGPIVCVRRGDKLPYILSAEGAKAIATEISEALDAQVDRVLAQQPPLDPQRGHV